MCSRAQEVVPVAPTPIEVEAYDSDHETSDQVTTKPDDKDAYYFRVVHNPVLEVMLLDNNEPSNYEEAMACPDSNKWLEAMKS